jgi:hypothetical protein
MGSGTQSPSVGFWLDKSLYFERRKFPSILQCVMMKKHNDFPETDLEKPNQLDANPDYCSGLNRLAVITKEHHRHET